MKKNIFLSLIIAAALMAGGNAFAAGVAYVDVAEVFDNYQKTKDQDLAMKNIGEQKEKERAALVTPVLKSLLGI